VKCGSSGVFGVPTNFSPSCYAGHRTIKMDSLQQVDFWSKLPIELFLQILSYLPIVDLGRIGRVSKLWKQVSENNQLWVRACGCNMPQLSKAIPLKTYYVNCIRNWIHGKFMSFDLPNKNGFYHLCEIFNNETLVTGTTSGLYLLLLKNCFFPYNLNDM
jgi:hypothetical protein